MNRGEIWNVKFPDTDANELKDWHPAVVLSVDLQFGRENMVFVVPLSDAAHLSAQFRYVFRVEHSPTNGLTKPSTALCMQARAVAKRRIGQKRGQIESEHLQRIESELKRMLGIT